MIEDVPMINNNWLKIIFITLVIQMFLTPILWRDFLPVKELILKRLRIISMIFLGPIFLLLCVVLNPTIYEGGMVPLLSGICVGIQGIILSLLYRGKEKTRVRKVVRPISMIITYALVVLILLVVGVYFLVYHVLYKIGIIILAIGTCVSIIGMIKIEKVLSKPP